MRLLINFEEPDQARQLNRILTDKGIENQLDVQKNSDWGDPDYGNQKFAIWVIDEDKFDEAKALADNFLKHPEAFKKPIVALHPFQKVHEKLEKLNTPIQKKGDGIFTRFLILACVLLFFFSPAEKYPNIRPPVPYFPSSVERELAYDYPLASQIFQKFVNLYGDKEHTEVSPEGQYLFSLAAHTPYWKGLYDLALEKIEKKGVDLSAPLFEKIREGEIWRLFTPIFLHGNLLHILFNMLWLYVLGREVENIAGIPRYLLFTLGAALFSNTAQYLMSGPNFVGYSGVICALLTLTATRQNLAPWEGYTLQKPTYYFLIIFIFTMMTVQSISFILEAFFGMNINVQIANTAHIAGAIFGWVIGRTSLMAWKG
jgi:GlpG protein